MQPDTREHFWNAVVWPILWPVLLAQAALVMLCVLVGLFMWGMSPNQVSWSTTLWLTLALLLGSCMNVGAFLMLLKTRAKYKDVLLMEGLAELERNTEALYRVVSQASYDEQPEQLSIQTPQVPLQRLSNANQRLSELVSFKGRVAIVPAVVEQSKHEKTLLDDLHHQQQQLKHLMAGRDRAREESRLKSDYLTLLQREADSLFAYLNDLVQKGNCEECQQSISHMQNRLADIRALLASFAQESQESLGKAGDDEVVPPSVKRQLKVLVVDDGPVNLMLARQMLEAQGFYVDGVSSGEQALERQQTAFYDLVFMDIFMPTLDGFETARRWRNHERVNNSPRSVLVALTANVDNAGRGICESAGIDDVLAKPYQPETLVGMITKWVPTANHEISSS
ncbi:MAG: response regulator [Halomonas sp.]|nr:response regulator [Halomonas sp.]MCC5901339.1 response regulator [Halomonas sp.]